MIARSMTRQTGNVAQDAVQTASVAKAKEVPKDLPLGTPERIRTAVTALRGRRPGPLDDGGRTCRSGG